jgi:hypothetical protein
MLDLPVLMLFVGSFADGLGLVNIAESPDKLLYLRTLLKGY